MVKVTVLLNHPVPSLLNIASKDGNVRCEVDVGVNPTIINLIDELAQRYGSEAKDALLKVRQQGLWPLSVIVNYTTIAGLDTPLSDGDVVSFHVPAIVGGSAVS